MQTQHGRTLTMDQRTHDQGRHERFAELYAAHYRPLVAFCRRLVGREPEAEELAQEAFLRAWASWDRYAPSRPFWPWVSTIARRLCIDHGRRVHLARRKGPSSGDRHAPSPEELVETDEEYRWARAALAELRPDHRRVLRLREVEGWSYDRIADHEGVSVESVRGSLRRARVGLRAAYARMVSSWPVIVVLALVRGIRRHVDWSVQRLQHAAADGAPIGSRASDTVAALLALALGAGAAAVPMASGVPAPAGSAGRTGTVVATAAGENGSSAALGSAAGSSTTTTAAVGQDDGAGRRTARDGDQHPLPVIVPGRGPGVPEGSNFESFTPSPNYDRDHVVYASGFAARDCAVRCPVLFRSNDGGDSWTRIRSVDYPGGTVMLSPSYPDDPRIFVISPNSLRVSEDNGVTFRPLTPAGGYAAMSPGFSSTDRHILVGAMPGWIYHDDTMAVTPFDTVPESATSVSLSFAYSPSYPADGRLLVGGTASAPMGTSVVSECRGSDCTPPAPLFGSTGTPAVFTARSYASSGLAFAWQLDRLYRSVNGGGTFAPVQTPTDAQVQGVADDTGGKVYVAKWSSDSGSSSSGGLFVSSDRGTTWTRLGIGTPLENGALAVTPLAGGRLLAAPYAGTGAGLLCSSDGGHSWAPRCSD